MNFKKYILHITNVTLQKKILSYIMALLEKTHYKIVPTFVQYM